MRKAKIILGSAVLLLAVTTIWQVTASEIANYELRDDLREIAAQNRTRIGLAAFQSDEELRGEVIRAAKEEGIQLEPAEVTVQRTGIGVDPPGVFLLVDYNAHVKLPGCSFPLHFTGTSAR
jgi:hypothetical protein